MNHIFFLLSLLGTMTEITTYKNDDVKAIRPMLDEWSIDAYREYPYLYVYQQETGYNEMFEVDPDAVVLIAEQDGKKVGGIYANPLSSPHLKDQCYTPAAYLDQIKALGYNPEKIYYISSFIFQKEVRQDKALADLLFAKVAETARALGKTHICYMEIEADPNHPLKPSPYYPSEPWGLLNKNFTPMNIAVKLSWPTLQQDGSVVEQEHKLPLYILEIYQDSI